MVTKLGSFWTNIHTGNVAEIVGMEYPLPNDRELLVFIYQTNGKRYRCDSRLWFKHWCRRSDVKNKNGELIRTNFTPWLHHWEKGTFRF